MRAVYRDRDRLSVRATAAARQHNDRRTVRTEIRHGYTDWRDAR